MLKIDCDTPDPSSYDHTEAKAFPPEFGRSKDSKSIEVSFKGEHYYIVGMTGSGKSYATRKIAELAETRGVPILIFDIENEFASLAEKFPEIHLIDETSFPHLLDAEIIASAIDYLHRSGASAIIELRGLGLKRQQAIVGAAIAALMSITPYRPRVVIIDEAHLLASSEAKSDSRGPIEDLMARGRKQLLTGVLATQRHTKVSANARSQAAHRLIGLNKEQREVDSISRDLQLEPSAKEALKRLVRGEFFYSSNAHEAPILLDVSPTISRHGGHEAEIDLVAIAKAPFDVVARHLQEIKSPFGVGEGLLPERKNQPLPADVIATPLAASQPERTHPDTAEKMLHILGSLDDRRLTYNELGLLIAVRPKSTAFGSALNELQRLGLVKRGKSSVALTARGSELVTAQKPIAVLAAELRSRVPANERAILDVIVAAKQKPVTISQIAEQCGLSPRSRNLPKVLGRQSRSGLIKSVKGAYAPSPAYLSLLSR